MDKRKWTKDEVRKYMETNGRFIYYNSDDANIFVPKFYGLGFTVNWAQPASWALIGGIVAVCALITILSYAK